MTLVMATPLLAGPLLFPPRSLEGGRRKGGRKVGRPCGSRWRNPRDMQSIPESCFRCLRNVLALPPRNWAFATLMLPWLLFAGGKREEEHRTGDMKMHLETLHYSVKPPFQNIYSGRNSPVAAAAARQLAQHTQGTDHPAVRSSAGARQIGKGEILSCCVIVSIQFQIS